MCGIAGIWNIDGQPVCATELERVTRALAHRGPDAEGFYIRGSIGLGHRRLAILDPSEAGRQPMSYGQGRFWITFNGEIYNFLELREELKVHGHQFISETDTETILAAYAQWGEDCQFRFNGMWAFALWDAREQILFLSRDRFGVKPLHYLCDGERFAFASEMKALVALDQFSAAFDAQMVATTLVASSSLEATEHCILKGIKRLPSGHCLTLRRGQPRIVRRWWRTSDHLETVPDDFGDQAEEYRDLFLDACRIRMRSDVPVATSLSGGLDSSAVLCGLTRIRAQSTDQQRLASDWQRAFVATYPGTGQDETAYARAVVEHTGARGVYVEINPNLLLNHLDDYLLHYEEIQDIHLGPWLVYREMRREGVVVSLDGHGGDETLGGYVRYPITALAEALRPWPHLGRALDMQRVIRSMTPSIRRRIRQTTRHTLQAVPPFYRVARLLYDAVRHPPFANGCRSGRAWLRITPLDTACLYPNDPLPGHYDPVNRQLYRDFHFTILPAILRNFDRLSMSHGVEVRAPFLDWRLVCYAMSLPSTSKLGGGYTKRILRESLRGVLPDAIRTRTTKIGFGNPLHAWLKAPLKSFVQDAAASVGFLHSDIWNGPAVRQAIERAYRVGDYATIVRAWPYIHAATLRELYRSYSQHAPRAPASCRPLEGLKAE